MQRGEERDTAALLFEVLAELGGAGAWNGFALDLARFNDLILCAKCTLFSNARRLYLSVGNATNRLHQPLLISAGLDNYLFALGKERI